jgi:hypothetical protein
VPSGASLRAGCHHKFRHVLLLEAERHENMAKPIERDRSQKVIAEVDGEAGAKVVHLADEGRAIECCHLANKVVNLVGTEHLSTPLRLPRYAGLNYFTAHNMKRYKK